MLKVAFRCDASTQMGTGHVMRCLTLANELRVQGVDVTFICREHPGHLFDLIESAKHRLLRLPILSVSAAGRLAHAQWLGATQEGDARQARDAVTSVGGVDWLIVDHYALDAEWETAMRSCATNIMVIDDLADRTHDCDVLVDQNLRFPGAEERYETLVPPACKRLLGPRYAMLRPEFVHARDVQVTRDGSVRRILVFLGGSDSTNETSKVLEGLKRLERSEIAIDVVTGSTNPHHEAIAALCRLLPNATLHRQTNDMAELMAKADLAIGAGGGAMWERCSMGLPTIVMSVAENQRPSCEAAGAMGAIIFLGDAQSVDSELLLAATRVALASSSLMKGVGEKCAALVDGQGVRRVARQLIAPRIMLRPATWSDREPVLAWRNAEETRMASNETRLISQEEHDAWFRKTLESPDIQLLIGESDQQAVGVLRLDRNGTRVLVSVYLVPGYYGKGIGTRLIEQGGEWVSQCWPAVTFIEAVIKEGNAASVGAFTEAGYRRNSCTYVKKMGVA